MVMFGLSEVNILAGPLPESWTRMDIEQLVLVIPPSVCSISEPTLSCHILLEVAM